MIHALRMPPIAAALPAATLAFAFALPATAFAASSIDPAQPYAFDPVNLRMTVDSCAFAPEAVNVGVKDHVIEVRTRLNRCLLPGEPRVVDIRVGSLPPGAWRVNLLELDGDVVRVVDAHAFEVRTRPEIAVYPPPPKPLTDYSGHWYRPPESGWGLSLHQSPTHVVFAAWYVYDDSGNPAWYVIQDGRWVDAMRWSGTVIRTSGPPFFAPAFDPARVTRADAGTATFDFTQRPGEEGWASFSYTVDGRSGAKRITRLQF